MTHLVLSSGLKILIALTVAIGGIPMTPQDFNAQKRIQNALRVVIEVGKSVQKKPSGSLAKVTVDDSKARAATPRVRRSSRHVLRVRLADNKVRERRRVSKSAKGNLNSTAKIPDKLVQAKHDAIIADAGASPIDVPISGKATSEGSPIVDTIYESKVPSKNFPIEQGISDYRIPAALQFLREGNILAARKLLKDIIADSFDPSSGQILLDAIDSAELTSDMAVVVIQSNDERNTIFMDGEKIESSTYPLTLLSRPGFHALRVLDVNGNKQDVLAEFKKSDKLVFSMNPQSRRWAFLGSAAVFQPLALDARHPFETQSVTFDCGANDRIYLYVEGGSTLNFSFTASYARTEGSSISTTVASDFPVNAATYITKAVRSVELKCPEGKFKATILFRYKGGSGPLTWGYSRNVQPESVDRESVWAQK